MKQQLGVLSTLCFVGVLTSCTSSAPHYHMDKKVSANLTRSSILPEKEDGLIKRLGIDHDNALRIALTRQLEQDLAGNLNASPAGDYRVVANAYPKGYDALFGIWNNTDYVYDVAVLDKRGEQVFHAWGTQKRDVFLQRVLNDLKEADQTSCSETDKAVSFDGLVWSESRQFKQQLGRYTAREREWVLRKVSHATHNSISSIWEQGSLLLYTWDVQILRAPRVFARVSRQRNGRKTAMTFEATVIVPYLVKRSFVDFPLNRRSCGLIDWDAGATEHIYRFSETEEVEHFDQ